MVHVDDRQASSSEADPAETSTTNYVRFSGQGLPGGEQQVSNVKKSPEQAEPEEQQPYQRAIPLQAAPSSSSTSVVHHSSYPVDENDHKYVGLVNQAMTCYLNSLVQSLYMTPEFRNAMYEWEYISSLGGPKASGMAAKRGESSIPCQLQKLFLLLQTTDNDALETRDLTASFGWSASEAYDQHDVQELCRLMFDALEQKWKATKHEKLIQDLYRGTMEDFVKCLTCGKENVRTDYFLDLPLAVKPFGAVHAFRSVEEALHAFTQPELLDGSNQYSCENCKTKQDAHKGLRITQFPYLLTIQLKRFDFDYTTLHRIKLNDRMTFPDILDLNSYIYNKNEAKSEAQSISRRLDDDDDEDDHVKMDLGSPNNNSGDLSDAGSSNPYLDRENVRVGQPIDHKAVDKLLENGENVYELFSVMVHSGSAAGGHYFAYIKNMEQDRWYSFNDTRVDFASVEEIEKTFGGHSGGWNASNTNAYMLMYRKIDKTRNSRFIHTNELPKHILRLQQRWREQEREAEEQRLLQQSLVTVQVSLNYAVPSVNIIDKKEVDLLALKHKAREDFVDYVTEIPRTQSIWTVYHQAFSFFAERAKTYGLVFPKNNCRLLYVEKESNLKMFHVKSEMEKKTLKSLFYFTDPEPLHRMNFLFDVRIASSFFNVEQTGGRMVEVIRVDVGKRVTMPHIMVYIRPGLKIVEFRQLIGGQFRDDIHDSFSARMVLESHTNGGKLVQITKEHNPIYFDAFIREHAGRAGLIFYFDGGLNLCSAETVAATNADRELPFEQSMMFEILDRKYFAMTLKMRFPSQDEIDRAATAASAVNGPSWTDIYGPVDQTNADFIAEAPILEAAIPNECDEDAYASGRVSTASMRSNSIGDLDSADVNPITGSFCNNTPQMSPSVSEGDDLDHSEGEISSFELRNQLNAERTMEYMQEQHFQNYEQMEVDFASPSVKKKNLRGIEETLSESAASSGQSTIVASTSLQAGHIVAESNTSSSGMDGKIVVLNENENYRNIDIDSRLTIGELKKWIANQMSVSRDQFVILKHSTDDGTDSGYELQANDDDSVGKAFQSCMISIKLRPPLKMNERIIQVVHFDMRENNRENWKTLFDIVASSSTLIGDVLLQCLRLYKDIYAEELKPEMVRLRDIPAQGAYSGKSALCPNEPMSARSGNWAATLYLQIILEDDLIGAPGDPVLVRRFRPSTVEVGPTQEVLVDPKAPNQLLAFLEALSKHSQIPIERIGMLELSSYNWSKWPYQKSRLDMLDGKEKFVTDYHKTYEHPRDFIQKVGVRVIYYKDMGEKAKELTDDERKQIKIKEMGSEVPSNRRKERPLRIQMSSVSEA
ncbi:unnamed protein product [Caenorhabditis bovis]|uniref:Ubiquitin carboxyl-terminal hydrolase 47 n=1 Tax=Caenorhabditis bovis TaxID=2654633 RepID=A0A8S1F052_9PELO|nr:unnamed protein product [Caenorhabditis bovis]